MIKIGSDFSGVGAFNQALKRLKIDYKEIFACDMDKYARQTFIHNYGEPDYYPTNVYEREIPAEPLDIYMTSPPCQAFSLAGNRKGEADKRGILFYNSHEFIKKNKPRFFIFENVKGLMSDNGGKTFGTWIDYLGGKSINRSATMFPHEESVPYHIYYAVLNAKDYGVPQNRERVFIVGIRDDSDNNFSFPRPFHLIKRLKDVLESEVDEKYYLSDKAINGFINHAERHAEKGNGFKFTPTDGSDIAVTITTHEGSRGYNNFIKESSINVGNVNPSGSGMNGNVFSDEGLCPTLTTNKGEGIKIENNYRIRKLTPRECFRLMDFPEDFIERTLNSKKHFYFQFVYSIFDINKKETSCNAKLKVVKDTQTPKNLETYVLCTTKECQKMDALTTLKQRREIKTENNENPLNVNFAIEVLGELERKECVTNTIKWTDCTETLYMLMKEGKNQVVKDISEIQKDKSYIEKSLKITLEENLSEEKLFITLILLKQIMTSTIYTYVKMPLNTQRFISSTVVYEKKSERLLLSYLKMEYTGQVVSDSMLYKQAGNSIVVAVLANIIKQLKI